MKPTAATSPGTPASVSTDWGSGVPGAILSTLNRLTQGHRNPVSHAPRRREAKTLA